MSLENTKLTLRRLKEKFGEETKGARKDIKPDYSGLGLSGYNYMGIEDSDKDTIYSAISGLAHMINNPYSGIAFNVEHVFVTEKKAVKALKDDKKFIEEQLLELDNIKTKYENKNIAKYPIDTCYEYFKQVNEILEEIFESQEFKLFENPKSLDTLYNELNDLKFQVYWNQKERKYVIHLFAFIPFIGVAAYMILSKENLISSHVSKYIVIMFGAFLTIIFNLLYNNHSSFKDSFKLLTKTSRLKLIQKERDDFFKNKNNIGYPRIL